MDPANHQRIEDRSAQTDAGLRQLQKLGALGHLACGVAHDFNNLLVIVTLHAEAILDDPEGPRVAKCARRILEGCERGARLTRQLLAFGCRETVELVPLDLSEVVSGVCGMLKRLIGKDCRIELKLAEKLPLVRADLGQIEQVAMNLVINARDAMPSGGLITVETRAEDDGVLLRVEDTGCGMAPEVRARAFEPFFTTKGAGRGTGLGLWTVDEIVRHHDGSVSLESETGRGTVVRIRFPRAAHGLVERDSAPQRRTDEDM